MRRNPCYKCDQYPCSCCGFHKKRKGVCYVPFPCALLTQLERKYVVNKPKRRRTKY